MNMKWYVVYTKPDSEKKVSEILTRKKIENYSPVNSASNISSNSKKTQSNSLFKGYVFVKITEHQQQDLKKINDVLNFLHWMGKPVTVKSVEIKAIKLFLSEYTDVTVEKTAIKPGTINPVNYIGTDHEVPLITIRNKKALVNLPSLGYIMTAEVDTPNVRIISPESAITESDAKPNKLFNKVSEFNNSLKSYWVKAFALSVCVLLITK